MRGENLPEPMSSNFNCHKEAWLYRMSYVPNSVLSRSRPIHMLLRRSRPRISYVHRKDYLSPRVCFGRVELTLPSSRVPEYCIPEGGGSPSPSRCFDCNESARTTCGITLSTFHSYHPATTKRCPSCHFEIRSLRWQSNRLLNRDS